MPRQFTDETLRTLKQTMLKRADAGWRFTRDDIASIVGATTLTEKQVMKWGENLLTRCANNISEYLKKEIEKEDKVF